MDEKLVKISKQYAWEASHQLYGHDGQCKNNHGHSYTVEVWVKGNALPETDVHKSDYTMLLDYKDLDAIMKPLVGELDHSFMTSDKLALPLVVEQFLGNVVYIDVQRTTAEELAKWFWRKVAFGLRKRENLYLLGVIVKETAKSSAEYIEELRHHA